MPTSREYLKTLAAQQDLNWDGNCLPEETEAEETQEPEKKRRHYKRKTINNVSTTDIDWPSDWTFR